MKKLLGDERRYELLTILKNAKATVTGNDLAKLANVSRQVIVSDMNLLKARNEPIVSTSQGYVYLRTDDTSNKYERKIVSVHTADQAEDEMLTIVDCGVTIESVIVDHPVYGEITASMMISNRLDVQKFIEQVNDTKANYLSLLTNGTHLHVISAPTIQQLDRAEQLLREKGYLVET